MFSGIIVPFASPRYNSVEARLYTICDGSCFDGSFFNGSKESNNFET